MLGILAVAATVGLAIWFFFIKPLSFWKKLGVKQSKPWIIFGDSWRTVFRRIGFGEFVYKMYNMHPGTRYSGFYNFNTPVLVLKDPELIKQLTVKDFDHFTDHVPFIDADTDRLWSNGLLSLKGERWKEMRSTLSPTFSSSKIKKIYVLMLETAENFVTHFIEKHNNIIEIEMKDTYSRFTNDVIATTAFGLQVNSLKDRKNIFWEMGKKLTEFAGIFTAIKILGHQAFPKLFKYLGVPFLDKEASKFFCTVINETIKAREEQNIIRVDMLHLMLEAKNGSKDHDDIFSNKGKSVGTFKITNADIMSQALIFFFGGFDTISTALSFGSYELALNKDLQDRLRKEINETHKDGKVTYEELMEMKYMDMVVSEILRKWPPFPVVDRVCTKSYTIEPVNIDEKPVPLSENQVAWLPIYGLHRDPKYFPNPEKFDPERFSDENKNKIVPYSYIPFGSGPRACIGNRFALLEIKALLFNILLHYEILPTKKTQIPLLLSKDFSQLPVDGLWLGLRPIRI